MAKPSARPGFPLELRKWLKAELRSRGVKDYARLTEQLSRKVKGALGASTGKVDSTEDLDELCCSFCGKSRKSIKKLVAGPVAMICSECIELCCGILDHEDELRAAVRFAFPEDTQFVSQVCACYEPPKKRGAGAVDPEPDQE
jgi:hypothetical protein